MDGGSRMGIKERTEEAISKRIDENKCIICGKDTKDFRFMRYQDPVQGKMRQGIVCLKHKGVDDEDNS